MFENSFPPSPTVNCVRPICQKAIFRHVLGVLRMFMRDECLLGICEI